MLELAGSGIIAIQNFKGIVFHIDHVLHLVTAVRTSLMIHEISQMSHMIMISISLAMRQ